MKKISVILILVILFSCNEINENNNDTGKSSYTEHSKGFSVKETNYGYKLKVYNPWQGAESQTFEYQLSRNRNKDYIQIPVESVVCLSTTHLSFIESLGKTSTIEALSGTDFVFSEKIRKKIDSGKISETGFAGNFNLEKIASIKPDVVFAYVVNGSELKQLNQLKEIGIPVVLIGDYLENTPLAKAEWLKFFALFFDKSDIAEKKFNRTVSNYDSIKMSCKKLESGPSVITNIPFEGVWWIPENDSYLANLIKDAGGKYLFNEMSGSESRPVDIEKVYNKSKDADIWIHTGNYSDYKSLFKSDHRLKAFVKDKNISIFNNNKRKYGKGNDFFESGTVNPDKLLQDLSKIFHPDLAKNDSLIYYQKLSK